MWRRINTQVHWGGANAGEEGSAERPWEASGQQSFHTAMHCRGGLPLTARMPLLGGGPDLGAAIEQPWASLCQWVSCDKNNCRMPGVLVSSLWLSGEGGEELGVVTFLAGCHA